MLSIALRLGGNAFHKSGAAPAKALSPVVLADLISGLARVLLPTDLRYMVMIALSVVTLKMFSPEIEIFFFYKAKREKNTFLSKVWINADVQKYVKRQEMFFVINLRLSDHKVLTVLITSFIQK